MDLINFLEQGNKVRNIPLNNLDLPLLSQIITHIEKTRFTKTILALEKEDAIFLINNLPALFDSDDVVKLIASFELTYRDLPLSLRSNLVLVFSTGYYDFHQIKNNNKIMHNRSWISMLISHDAEAYLYTSTKLKKDKDFVLMCLIKNPYLMKYLPTPFNKDKKYANIALGIKNYSQNAAVWQYLNKELTLNRVFVLESICHIPTILRYLEPIFQDDHEIVKKAVILKGDLLKYASERLKNDISIASLACLAFKEPFEHCSSELKNNINFVTPLLKKFPSLIFQCGDKIKESTRVAKIVCNQTLSPTPALSFFNEKIRDNRQIALASLMKNVHSFEFISQRLQNDKSFILDYANSDFVDVTFLKQAPFWIKEDLELMLIFCKKYSSCVEYSADNLKKDPYYIEQLLQNTHNSQITKLYQLISFDSGQEESFLLFLEHPYYKSLYNDIGVKYFHQQLKLHMSDYFIKILENTSDFYQYLRSYVLSQELNQVLTTKPNVKKIKI